MADFSKLVVSSGNPSPLGANLEADGVNFALFSSTATEVELVFFSEGSLQPIKQISLNAAENKTDSIWHIHIKNLSRGIYYAYLVDREWVIDPYAKELNTPKNWGDIHYGPILGNPFPDLEFDWGQDAPLRIPLQELIIYEMHVRGFTEDKSSGVERPGTFLGLIEKIPYLKQLGINAVELLPVFEFDENANIHKNPKTGMRLFNYWGYSTINFFSPMARYGTIVDFKKMVQALHQAGIEVILDVVYNHVGKSTLAMIDKATYFIVDDQGNHTDFTGCGNTLNSNHPIVTELILSSLRYWVSEMHVDGFRFDLASIFCRGDYGNVLDKPPVLEAINRDPVLSKTKLIAEPWDAAGLYQVGSFPGGPRWADWNGKFRDVIRRFLKGTDGQASEFATMMMGSQDLYNNGRSPCNSINFVTVHDGFSLYDLVSYDEKHNEENGEENRDGSNWEGSWNCGHEGPTDDPQINELRQRQMRNFFLAVILSVGTPMSLMGDEYGHTQNGNNNTYCQDGQINYFLWDRLAKNEILHQFYQNLISLRKKSKLFQRTSFLTDEDVTWHGHLPDQPDFGHESRFIAYCFHDPEEDLYIAFNANFEPADIAFPPLPEGKTWKRMFDTALPTEPAKDLENSYHMVPYSALVLLATT